LSPGAREGSLARLRLPPAIRSRVSRKLLLAVGGAYVAVAIAGLAWLRRATRGLAPDPWPHAALVAIALAVALAAVHVVAVDRIVRRPLRALRDAIRRARDGAWLARVPKGDDEIGELGEAFDATLNAIVDLHVQRADDALAMAAMQRELTLKAELEEQHRLLDVAHRQSEARLRELTLLAELSHALNAVLDLDALCRAVVDTVGRRLGFETFALLLADEARGDLVVRSAVGVGDRAEGSRLALGDGAGGLAAREKRVVLVSDATSDARTAVRSWLPPGAGSLLAVPLVHQEECVGVLDFWRGRPDAFGDDEIRFLRSVAGQAAMAIANARLHRRALELSVTDPLTGTLNRRGLADRLRRELDRAARFGNSFSLLMVDVDRLKKILEHQGLVAGDALLRDLARVVTARMREVDTLARYRGDKFAVVLPRAGAADALAVADAVRRDVESWSGGRVTVSVGVATYPADAPDVESLVDAADAALFAAKAAGRNAVRACAPGMREDPARPRAGGSAF
jgi:diguanylate cyclase (GGDEF)-like protein